MKNELFIKYINIWLKFIIKLIVNLCSNLYYQPIFYNIISYIYQNMLPKLQQSSIAQSLRRDNPANHNYCTYFFIQVRINLKISLVIQLMKITNPGKLNLHLKIHIHHLGISQVIIYLKRNQKKKPMNLTTKILFQDHLAKIKEKEELEEKPHLPQKRKKVLMHLFQ